MSRQHQRLVFGGLSGLVLLASLQPLLLPRQPLPPHLPLDAPLPAGWRALASSDSPVAAEALPRAPEPRPYRPLFSAVAVGNSVTLSGPDGALLRLTPMASWSGSALDPATLASDQDAADTSAKPACLTPQGQLESSLEPLLERIGQAEPLPAGRRLLYTLLPARGRSFNCLLVSTNRPALLLPGTPEGQPLWSPLSRTVHWPPPPGH